MNKIYEIDDTNKYYPIKLLKIDKHPKKIYVMGNIEILNNKSLAIVGSRDNTKYGKYYASYFAQKIAQTGITIVSGLAIGIDSISHQNSMFEKGKTIAVIGSGFNNIYPPENIELVNQILENDGAIISEYSAEIPVDLKKFPKRNRIISGISDGVLVVEAKYRSGSSITAKYAFEQEKEVFCIPARIDDITGKGTNNLIKEGANLVTDVNEILIKLGEPPIVSEKNESKKNKSVISNSKKRKNQNVQMNKTKEKHIDRIVESEYLDIYELIKNTPMDIDEISRTLKMAIFEINTKLTMMELEGYIKIFPGNIVKIKE